MDKDLDSEWLEMFTASAGLEFGCSSRADFVMSCLVLALYIGIC